MNVLALPQARFPGSDPCDRKLRVAMYSHDTMGLGHMRRNLLIAQTLASPPIQAVVLMVAGARQMNNFIVPPGVDSLTLPALCKNADGQYESRCLDVSLRDLIALRGKAIHAALQAFEPDVLIVDNVPRGAVRELDPTLEYLQTRKRTRCVLGLREILDDPETVCRQWRYARNEEAICNHYDAVWVYGDPIVYDLVKEYGLCDDVAAKVHYTGYLDQQKRLKTSGDYVSAALAALRLPRGRLVLCMTGGGQDGFHVAETFAKADLPPQFVGLIVTGPFMPTECQERLRRLSEARERIRVIEFFEEPALLFGRADRLVAMGGYNTTCEALSFGKPALIIPRVTPRREQLIRAERMSALGLLDFLHPDELTPNALSEWLKRDLFPPRIRGRIDLNGLARLPGLLHEVLSTTMYCARSCDQKEVISYVSQ